MSKGKLFVFSAPSGAGKTTLVKYVLSEFPEFEFSISATTRRAREFEKDSIDYYFITEEEFIKKINDGEFIEWEKFYDYYYGTPKKPLVDNLKRGISSVFEVDVKGALTIKENFPNAVLIFITPPSLEILRERLTSRKTETETDLQKRFERAELELNFKDKFDFVIVNNKLEDAKKEIKQIIIQELNKGD